MSSIRAAVSFLTRVPVGTSGLSDDALAAAVPWFPVVGALVGLATSAIYILSTSVVSPLAAAALAVAASMLLTGALHEDGLADIADAFGGGWERADVIRILKDSRQGTFGVLALVISTVVKIALIATFAGVIAVVALTAAHASSRALAIGLLGVVGPAHAEGLGASYARSLPRNRIVVTVVVGVALAGLLIGPWAAPALAVAVLPIGIVGRLATTKIGGVTGDVLGAAQQLAELAVLAVASAVVVNGWGDLAWWR
jgi:adenosylcobinamide-GDP ribazoletransferase